MRLNCGKSFQARIEAKKQWHRWFAWRPVRIATHDCRWLEYVERKGELCCGMTECFWEWSYRPIAR